MFQGWRLPPAVKVSSPSGDVGRCGWACARAPMLWVLVVVVWAGERKREREREKVRLHACQNLRRERERKKDSEQAREEERSETQKKRETQRQREVARAEKEREGKGVGWGRVSWPWKGAEPNPRTYMCGVVWSWGGVGWRWRWGLGGILPFPCGVGWGWGGLREWGGSKGSIGDQKCWFCLMKVVFSGGGPRSGFASRVKWACRNVYRKGGRDGGGGGSGKGEGFGKTTPPLGNMEKQTEKYDHSPLGGGARDRRPGSYVPPSPPPPV